MKNIFTGQVFIGSDGFAELVITWEGKIYLFHSRQHLFQFLNTHEDEIKKHYGDNAPSELVLRVCNIRELPEKSSKIAIHGLESEFFLLSFMALPALKERTLETVIGFERKENK